MGEGGSSWWFGEQQQQQAVVCKLGEANSSGHAHKMQKIMSEWKLGRVMTCSACPALDCPGLPLFCGVRGIDCLLFAVLCVRFRSRARALPG